MIKKLFVLLIANIIYPQESTTQRLEESKNLIKELKQRRNDRSTRIKKLNQQQQDLDNKRPSVNIDALLERYKPEIQNRMDPLQNHIIHQDQKKPDTWNSCVAFIKDRYKFYTGLLAFCLVWRIAFYHVIDSARYLTQPYLWNSWRSDLTLNELLAFPKETITSWLLNDINARYPDKNPIQTFYADIKIEEDHLHKLLKIHQTPAPFSWFIPVVLFQSVPYRLKVLEHLKNLVILWELEQSRATLCKE